MTQHAASSNPRAVLYHGAGALFESIRPALDAEDIQRPTAIGSVSDISGIPDAPAVLLLEDSLARATPDLAGALQRLPESLVVIAEESVAGAVGEAHDRILLTLPKSSERAAALRAV